MDNNLFLLNQIKITLYWNLNIKFIPMQLEKINKCTYNKPPNWIIEMNYLNLIILADEYQNYMTFPEEVA